MLPKRSKNPALAAAMAASGKTGRTLARECGIHPVTLSHVLNLRVRPKPETVKRLALALHTSQKTLGFPKGGVQ